MEGRSYLLFEELCSLLSTHHSECRTMGTASAEKTTRDRLVLTSGACSVVRVRCRSSPMLPPAANFALSCFLMRRHPPSDQPNALQATRYELQTAAAEAQPSPARRPGYSRGSVHRTNSLIPSTHIRTCRGGTHPPIACFMSTSLFMCNSCSSPRSTAIASVTARSTSPRPFSHCLFMKVA